MSTETIVKIKKRVNPYTMIDSSIFLNSNLSWKAKGLMGYFLSRPEDWKIHLKDLYNQSTDGFDSVKSGLRELKENGYIELIAKREKGRIVSWEYIVYESPNDRALETSDSQPQEGFPPVDKPQVDNPPEATPPKDIPSKANPRYTNNNITNIDYTNNDYTNDFDNERYDLLIKKYEGVLLKSKLHLFEDNVSKIVEESLKSLYFDEEFSKKNLNLPLPLVRDTLEKISPLIIENAITRMKKALAGGVMISSTKHYLMSCIFNAITDYTSRELTDSDIFKPRKSIFELVKGTQFEEPVNQLSNSFSEIVFSTFFKDKISDISLENGTLTIVLNDIFLAATLTEKYSEKVKECFKQLNVEDVVFIANPQRSD
ncbi:MAG: hypothetical protein GX660_12985 [Clostridiaceae bacterium]|nr:hypothetical protein [Clostridiaceae bacterium]